MKNLVLLALVAFISSENIVACGHPPKKNQYKDSTVGMKIDAKDSKVVKSKSVHLTTINKSPTAGMKTDNNSSKIQTNKNLGNLQDTTKEK